MKLTLGGFWRSFEDLSGTHGQPTRGTFGGILGGTLGGTFRGYFRKPI